MPRNDIPEYGVWKAMRARCYNPSHISYKNYGQKGIVVCDRWLGDRGFHNFYEDMGPRQRFGYSESIIKNTVTH